MIKWDIDINGLMRKRVRVETKAGSKLVGKLTKLNTVDVEIQGLIVPVPQSIVLDASDTIDLKTIKRVALDK